VKACLPIWKGEKRLGVEQRERGNRNVGGGCEVINLIKLNVIIGNYMR
jgi:hypothetical protein